METCAGVVLAAGMGSRMKSAVPKPLHQLCGREMVAYPVEALRQAGVDNIVVIVSPAGEGAMRALLGDSVRYVVQREPLGTGHALLQAAPMLADQAEHVAVVGSDTPLLRPESVQALLELHLARQACISLLVSSAALPRDMGRLMREANSRIVGIVEAADASGADSANEVNGGVYWFQGSWLWPHLPRVPVSNRGETYLTSLVGMAADQGLGVEALEAADSAEVMGVNDRLQLANAQGLLYHRIRQGWMLQGVSMIDPASAFIDATAELGRDTLVLPNTMVLGASRIGSGCTLGPGSVIRDSQIGDHCRVTASHLEEATLEEGVDVGPFSHLRPGAYIEKGVHLGNFCEVKNSRLGQGSAMGHFGYVGDATVGAGVNLGAGAVTCNYDGENHQATVVEDGAFIGCDTMLVAPVRVGADAITAAGSVVTKDVPPARLAVGMPARMQDSKRIPKKKR